MAAFYLNRSYLAETVCINRFDKIPICNASCFLEKELDENQQKEKKAPDCRIIVLTMDHPAAAASLRPAPGDMLLTLYPSLPNPFPARGCSRLVFRPPCTA